MNFVPYHRTVRDETFRFLGARVQITHVVERADLVGAVQEQLECEQPEPTSRTAVERLVRERLLRYGEFSYEGETDGCYEHACAIVDRLFPELIEYQNRHNEPHTEGGTTP